MRKTIAAVTVGLLLVAGQAAATNNAAAARVGDRVGARAGASSEFQAPVGGGFLGLGGLGAGGLIVGGVLVATAITVGVVANDDNGAS